MFKRIFIYLLFLRVHLIIIICFLLSNELLFSQPNLGSWNILNLKYEQNKKLNFITEGQIRSLKFYDHFHYYEIKGMVNYKPIKPVMFSLGFGSYQTYREGGNFEIPKNNDEFRLWPQILFVQEINNLKIEQRYRTEMRFTSNGYRNRFRYRFSLAYAFGNDIKGYKPFQTSISNELFFTDKEPYFERNRIQLALNYKPTKNTTLQLGYLHQFDYKINDETGRDFLVLGYYIELFRNKDTDNNTESISKDL